LIASIGAASLIVLAACGGSSSGGGSAKAPDKLGAGEGQLDIIAWAGYAENGSNDPKVNWVGPFEKQTGCKVNVKIGNTSDEMVQLMKTGQYDGVSASGDATLRLIAAGDVAPVNTDLVPNYKNVWDYLKLKRWNSQNGKAYGIPHGWGANLLMWNTAAVSPAPDSWGAVFDPKTPYKGKVTAYDAPIYIADSALYLMKTQPDLGIKDPYSLNQKQFDAAVNLLKGQHGVLGEYWADYTKEQQAFDSGSLVLGTTWQIIANLVNADGKVKVQTIVPKEGSTGWSDTWMVSSKAKHPNCMYQWMNYIISPEVNAQVAEWFGEAPANQLACGKTKDPNHCKIFHADDQAYAQSLYYWTTPTKRCLDGSGGSCVAFDDWVKAWTEIKG
jgi:putative spermidine/putrescine transport system substrate-binding protein